MKFFTIPLALVAVVLSSHVALAQTSGSSMQSSSMMSSMPKCASGDSVVAVNTSTKMYMTMAQVKAATANMTPAQKQAMMAKNHAKMMCTSQATAMGAKPMTKPPM
ncbi:MAG TPA: hypothetical protein VGF98_04835 [Candidatus Tumulicola sp.]|jgi:hypothetical protein